MVARSAVRVVRIANIAFEQIYLRRNGAPALGLGALRRHFHTVHAVAAAQIALALPQHVDRLVPARVEPPAARHALRDPAQRRVQPVPEPGLGRPAYLEHLLGRARLPEPGDLVPDVAAPQLDPRRDGRAAELPRHGHGLRHAAAAGVSGEVSAALVEAVHGGGPVAGGGFIEAGGGGSGGEGGGEGFEGLLVEGVGVGKFLVCAAFENEVGVVGGGGQDGGEREDERENDWR